MFVYDTDKCTTDQLRSVLNGMETSGWEPHVIAHTGGRDWVVVCRREAFDEQDAQAVYIAALRDERDAARAKRKA